MRKRKVIHKKVMFVRRARSRDAAVLVELLAALGYETPIAHVNEQIAHATESSESVVFVAELESCVIGLASFHRIPLFHAAGFLGRITSFVVAPKYRKRGVGRLLVIAVEEFAWTHQCIRVEVTSGDHRADAHAFYENMGYEVDRRRFIKRKVAEPTPDRMPGSNAPGKRGRP
jgi:GNAT superfamily N-acetyltransferase